MISKMENKAAGKPVQPAPGPGAPVEPPRPGQQVPIAPLNPLGTNVPRKQ